jgi:hypothetical protein
MMINVDEEEHDDDDDDDDDDDGGGVKDNISENDTCFCLDTKC